MRDLIFKRSWQATMIHRVGRRRTLKHDDARDGFVRAVRCFVLMSLMFGLWAFPAAGPGAAQPGTFIDTFVDGANTGLDGPTRLVFGPNGQLYVSSVDTDEVLRYDGVTGAFIDKFVEAGSGGLDGPQGLVFDADDQLYVSSVDTDEVLRYDGVTGAFIDAFVTENSGGLDLPVALIFDPDGKLYVSSSGTNQILFYDGNTGAFIDIFVEAGSGGLQAPTGLVFGSGGDLFVSGFLSHNVLRYDGGTGAFLGVFVGVGSGGLESAKQLVFGPDGQLYVSSLDTDQVLRYDGDTGAFLGVFVEAGSGGLDGPDGLVFGPDGHLYVTSLHTDEVLRYQGPAAITFVVNSTGDASDANVGNGLCETATPGECTLRAAIEEANALAGADVIEFNIPGGGPHTIQPGSALPDIMESVVIDGYTQPGAAANTLGVGSDAVLLIELDGSNAGTFVHGLRISGRGSTVRGLVINRFYYGVGLSGVGSTGNIIEGNYLGTDVTGMRAFGNRNNGVVLLNSASDNTIGGTVPGARNLISGNGDWGVLIDKDAEDNRVEGNRVEGNYIGTDVTGMAALGNGRAGVFIAQGVSDTIIGGTAAGARNVISGNGDFGILVIDTTSTMTGNRIEGNYIGTDAEGMNALGGNAIAGVSIGGGARDVVVGGTTARARNVISGNEGTGVAISGVNKTDIRVEGNYIGTDVTGTVALGNGGSGVSIANGASGNTIGRAAGTAPGGTCDHACNLIAFNKAGGITIEDDAGTGNAILSNSIFQNGSLGIDLGKDGVTPNDDGDVDTGPNNLQNFPVLTNVLGGNNTFVQGTFSSTPNTSFTVQFFANVACGPSGHGDGEVYIGFIEFTTNANGNAGFSRTLAGAAQIGQFVTATATDPNGNTSEFSECFEIVTDVAVEDEKEAPTTVEIFQSYPNPFTSETVIPFALPEVTRVTLRVYDLLGRELAVLLDGRLPPGRHEVRWRADPLPAGVYIVRMEAAGRVQTRPLIRMK